MKNPDKIKAIPDDKMIELIMNSFSLQEILDKLEIKRDQRCKNLIKDFAIKHNISLTHMQGKNSLIANISKNELEKMVHESICWMDVIHKLGRSFHGSFYRSLKRLAKYHNIDTSHFDKKKALSINNGNRHSDEEMFTINSKISRAAVKKRIIDKQLIAYVCSYCDNIGLWNNKKLVLQLEHKNGVRNDNRLENLCFLCPNCHSQTETYTGKNNKNNKNTGH